MPARLPRICAPLSFWNFSAAIAVEPKVATARIATPVTRSRCSQLLIAFIETNLRGLPGTAGFLQHRLQRHARGPISQLNVFSGEPDLVAAAARLVSGFHAKLLFLHAPFAGAFVTHRRDRKRSVAFEYFPPMCFIGQLHPGELRLNLRTGELLEFLLGFGSQPRCKKDD